MVSEEKTAKMDWKHSYYAEADQSDALRKELVALRKDAERYRWLRERETDVRRYTLVGQRASERLDDQIDAALEESKAIGAV